ncbi:MAG: hypothetical protein Tsb0032_31330 [Kiloniellaceae bacterium]
MEARAVAGRLGDQRLRQAVEGGEQRGGGGTAAGPVQKSAARKGKRHREVSLQTKAGVLNRREPRRCRRAPAKGIFRAEGSERARGSDGRHPAKEDARERILFRHNAPPRGVSKRWAFALRATGGRSGA